MPNLATLLQLAFYEIQAPFRRHEQGGDTDIGADLARWALAGRRSKSRAHARTTESDGFVPPILEMILEDGADHRIAVEEESSEFHGMSSGRRMDRHTICREELLQA